MLPGCEIPKIKDFNISCLSNWFKIHENIGIKFQGKYSMAVRTFGKGHTWYYETQLYKIIIFVFVLTFSLKYITCPEPTATRVFVGPSAKTSAEQIK